MSKYLLLTLCISFTACSSAQIKFADKPIEHIKWDELLALNVTDKEKVNKKAEKLNIPVITMNNILKLI